MNAVELLGELLSKRSPKSEDTGMGGSVLERALEKQRREQAAQQPPQRAPEATPRHGGQTLEDVLHDLFGRKQTRQPASTAPEPSTPSRQQAETKAKPRHGYDEAQLNQRAVVLIRAMLNAAKADGKIDTEEEQAVLKRVGKLGATEVEFLKKEFARPVDIDEFVRDVPRGMEEEVYAMSLMAIELNNKKEALYLQQLSEGLRMDPQLCNKIHKHYDAPTIFV